MSIIFLEPLLFTSTQNSETLNPTLPLTLPSSTPLSTFLIVSFHFEDRPLYTMARGRQRSASNVSGVNSHQSSRPPTASPQLLRQPAAPQSDTIRTHNLTVLRRRDPSITGYLDHFSHVCLYRFNGEKWLREGFEGSMFLVEQYAYLCSMLDAHTTHYCSLSEDEPKYGMFILNRTNTGDYKQRIYPEDEMEPSGDYLMYRFFPDYTKRRTSMNLPYPLPPAQRLLFDAHFAKPKPSPASSPQADPGGSPGKEMKGDSTILGFWMFPTDDREPLKDVLVRYVTRVSYI